MIVVTATWEETAKHFRRVVDRLGKPIDEGIFETVVALNMLGITTRASCEGHLAWGLPYPWIDILPEDSIKHHLHQHLAQFYAQHPIDYDRALAWQGYRLRSTGTAFATMLSPDEQVQKLAIYQSEMHTFTTWLKSLL